jgi:hypothetical protein
MKRKMPKTKPRAKVADMTKGKPFGAKPKKPGADNAPFMKALGKSHTAEQARRAKKLKGVAL